jgi:hypothetical protein
MILMSTGSLNFVSLWCGVSIMISLAAITRPSHADDGLMMIAIGPSVSLIDAGPSEGFVSSVLRVGLWLLSWFCGFPGFFGR